MGKKGYRKSLETVPPPAELAAAIGFPVSDLPLLEQALTHRSFANETGIDSNERLEFLGDAVLGLVVGDYLFNNFPDLSEGFLAKARSLVVSAPTLARRAGDLLFGRYLRLGRGEIVTGGRTRDSNLADAFEAVIGAFYLQGGLDAARAFILAQLKAEITAAVSNRGRQDFKTRLQEELQSKGGKPCYVVMREEGPDHGKSFTVAVYVGGRFLGQGSGHSKKEAERLAAAQALAELHGLQKE